MNKNKRPKVVNNEPNQNVKSKEAAIRSCSVKTVFLKISQNSQENTCARVSFLIKLYVADVNIMGAVEDPDIPGRPRDTIITKPPILDAAAPLDPSLRHIVSSVKYITQVKF